MTDPQSREFEVHPDMAGRLRRVGTAMIADTATVVGDVRLGNDVGIWFGVTIRGDDSWIEIGDESNIQDNTVVHVDVDAPQRIGRGVTVGHGAILHGVEIGDYCLIGMGSRLLSGCRIGAFSIIGAGALVAQNAVVPPRSLVLGVPGKVRREISQAEQERLRWSAAHYVQRARSYLDQR